MAKYNSIHLKIDNPEAVHLALATYLSRVEWWKLWRHRGYHIHEPVDGWTEIEMVRSCMGAGMLTEYLSREFRCLALSLGYQSTVGFHYVRVCQEGLTLRVLCFSRGEDNPYQEEGKPMPFEEDLIQNRQYEVERELAEMDIDLQAVETTWMLKQTSLLPGCGDFANELGCSSFKRA